MKRPTEPNDLVTKRIVDAIRAGASLEGAARGAGLSPRTAETWLARGREEAEGAFASFARAVDGAELELEQHLVGAIIVAARTQWSAAAFLLERRFQRWAKPTSVTAGATTPPNASAAAARIAEAIDEDGQLLDEVALALADEIRRKREMERLAAEHTNGAAA